MTLTITQIENIAEKGIDPNLIFRLKKHWKNELRRIHHKKTKNEAQGKSN